MASRHDRASSRVSKCRMRRQHATLNSRALRSESLPVVRRYSSISWGSAHTSHACASTPFSCSGLAQQGIDDPKPPEASNLLTARREQLAVVTPQLFEG